jgi:hypothetical protein
MKTMDLMNLKAGIINPDSGKIIKTVIFTKKDSA